MFQITKTWMQNLDMLTIIWLQRIKKHDEDWVRATWKIVQPFYVIAVVSLMFRTSNMFQSINYKHVEEARINQNLNRCFERDKIGKCRNWN